ncbi:MAG: NAD(P)/FAD-dependent oxidoreductase [bacterium]
MPRIVVIGAGAAGTMAAIFAASAGAETILLERTADGGRKILISGGGRCNILPSRVDEKRFVTDSSSASLRKIVRSWPLAEQIAFFETELSLPLVEEAESAKLFPASDRARDVRDALLAHAARRGARFMPGVRVTGLARAEDRWRIECADGEAFDADAVIVATGGLSVPNTGSDGGGLSILERLGHTLNPTYAALTALTATPAPYAALAGISLWVAISAESGALRAAASGGFLFTHRGYSGPAVLDISHVAVRSLEPGAVRARIVVNWLRRDAAAVERLLAPSGKRNVISALRGELPERLVLALIDAAKLWPSRALAQLRREERQSLVDTLVRFELPWSGHEGYKSAEVTGGGVSLAEVDPRTMESRRHRGLFLCGEVLDAFGPIGGYNFLWAWATGRAAGLGAARALNALD